MAELANKPDPAGWLGAAIERTRQDSVLAPKKQDRPQRGHLRLRGTTDLCKSRLNKALGLVAEKVSEGVYRVTDEKTRQGDPEGVLPLDEWLNQPIFVLRRLYPGSPERVPDLEGWNSYWVNLTDPQIEPCYCRDMYVVAPSLGTPCKHVLAAMIADGEETVTNAAEELKKRNAIAAALKG